MSEFINLQCQTIKENPQMQHSQIYDDAPNSFERYDNSRVCNSANSQDEDEINQVQLNQNNYANEFGNTQKIQNNYK